MGRVVGGMAKRLCPKQIDFKSSGHHVMLVAVIEMAAIGGMKQFSFGEKRALQLAGKVSTEDAASRADAQASASTRHPLKAKIRSFLAFCSLDLSPFLALSSDFLAATVSRDPYGLCLSQPDGYSVAPNSQR